MAAAFLGCTPSPPQSTAEKAADPAPAPAPLPVATLPLGEGELAAIKAELKAADQAERCRFLESKVLVGEPQEAGLRHLLEKLALEECPLEVVGTTRASGVRTRIDYRSAPRFEHLDLFFARRGDGVGLVDAGFPGLAERVSDHWPPASDLAKAKGLRAQVEGLSLLITLVDPVLNPENLPGARTAAEDYLATLPGDDVFSQPIALQAALTAALLVDSPRSDVLESLAQGRYETGYLPITARMMSNLVRRSWDEVHADIDELSRSSGDERAPFFVYHAYALADSGDKKAALRLLEEHEAKLTEKPPLIAVARDLLTNANDEPRSYLASILTVPIIKLRPAGKAPTAETEN